MRTSLILRVGIPGNSVMTKTTQTIPTAVGLAHNGSVTSGQVGKFANKQDWRRLSSIKKWRIKRYVIVSRVGQVLKGHREAS